MAIVARMASRLAVVALASIFGCQPSASAGPTTAASAPLPSPTAGAVAPGPSCIPARPAAAPRPAWADRTFYEIFVRSFADSDGDGVGDLAGLTSRLDYLNDGDRASGGDLGVDGIWLMPVAEAASYHGYDVTDYTAVERDYGDEAGLRALVRAAHERGIAVIVDLVINHSSRAHPWFVDALAGGKHRAWYIWSDVDPGWPGPAGANPWHRTDAGDYYYGAFGEGMPDLNLRNAELTAEIERIATVWLEDFGVDGFRVDAAKHLIEDGPAAQTNTDETRRWLEAFTAAVHSTNPEALVVGEVFDSTTASSSYVPEVDTTFAFELAGRALLAIQAHDASLFQPALDEVVAAYAGVPYSAFLTNHDQPRVMSQLSSPAAGRVAATLLLTGPGVPFLYYGEEIGLTGGKPDERIRSPMPWTGASGGAGFTDGAPWEPLEIGWQTRNVAAQAADPASLLAHYRALIALRQAHPALRSGELYPVEATDDAVHATLARADREAVLVVTNLDLRDLADLRLSLPAGPCGLGPPAVAYADGIDAKAVQLPTVTGSGGLAGWRPAGVLPAYSTIIVTFGAISP